MKAALTFCIGKDKVILEIMPLYDLDQLCIKNFSDSNSIRCDERYEEIITAAINNCQNRYALKQKNGSINLFLLNDDNTFILTEENGKMVEKKAKVMFKGAIDDSVKETLLMHYKNNPWSLQELLKKLCTKLKKEYDNNSKTNVSFMDYNYFTKIQYDMFGDNKSLFSEKNINIENLESFNTNLEGLMESLNFNEIPYIYLSCRRTAINEIEYNNNEYKKGVATPMTEFEITRLRMFGEHSMVPFFEQQSVVDSYLKMQQEAKKLSEIDNLNDIKHENKQFKKI